MFDDFNGWWIGVGIGILMMAAAIVVGLIAIWSVGPVQGKLGGTAGMLGGAGFVIALGCGMASDW